MIGRRVLVGLLVLSGITFFGASRAAAQYPGQSTVLGSYEAAKHVAIFRVVTVEPSPYGPNGEGMETVEQITEPKPQKVEMAVVRSYKGGAKPGELFTFGQYAGADEGWTFEATDIGHDFLFYLDGESFVEGLWWANSFDRSRRVEDATDDLLYLNNMSKLVGKTRVSGNVSYLNNDGTLLEGITVQFTGATRSYVAKTDAHGVYEIYDLPVGKYMVRALLPNGWILDEDSWYVDEGELPEGTAPMPKFQIKVVAKKHVALNLFIKTDNLIHGKIYFPGGGSLAGEWVKATPVEGGNPDGYFVGQIEPDGSFSLNGLPSGGYVIVINEGGVVSATMPFKEFYYPGVTDRTLATVLYITPGQKINGINISAPTPAEIITIKGRMLFADGSPVVERSVDFTSTNTDPLIYGDASAITDADGKFTLRILKGQTGSLAGHFFSYIGEYTNSPELEAAIRAAAEQVATENPEPEVSTENTEPVVANTENPEAGAEAYVAPVYANLSTEVVTIEGNEDVSDISLQLPFPVGPKAEEPPAG